MSFGRSGQPKGRTGASAQGRVGDAVAAAGGAEHMVREIGERIGGEGVDDLLVDDAAVRAPDDHPPGPGRHLMGDHRPGRLERQTAGVPVRVRIDAAALRVDGHAVHRHLHPLAARDDVGGGGRVGRGRNNHCRNDRGQHRRRRTCIPESHGFSLPCGPLPPVGHSVRHGRAAAQDLKDTRACRPSGMSVRRSATFSR
ncbi:hypothetical protein RHRU231_750023 [Rhodococcus ruber]|uniref:Uncharacterized protein n=1 Tax=Rhodococcus ruber TaxID=1830 RepID=A0A098BSI1_9NOCA|nr:hypothetical protein RHRU231_750023 [Rhodococcus ruber]